MRPDTRRKFAAFLEQVAQLNGIDANHVSKKFTVTPSVQQTLEQRIQDSSDFLKSINIIGVSEQQGEKLGLGIGSPIASTTNTASADRATIDPTDMGKDPYHCTQTNSDTHISYSKLDAWAKFPNFQALIRDAIIKRQALDRIAIGFNGTSRAATSDRVANPLLQDVNIGWMQKYRTNAGGRVLSEVVPDSDAVTIGTGGDYANLDALVSDAVNNLIEPWFQDDTDLVAIVSRDLLHDKYFPMINQAHVPTEQLATQIIVSQKQLGGLKAIRVPYMPAGTIFITRLDNLSIYWQEGSRRRHIEENPKRDRIENYESDNEAYVVEDYAAGCLIENIVPYVAEPEEP